MGSKGATSVQAPDYSSDSSADLQAAQLDAKTSAAQLAQATSEYNQQEPFTQAYLQSMTANSNQETAAAQTAESEYQSVFQPGLAAFNKTAASYDSPAQAQANAGSAMADVSNSFNAQRASSLSSLESYGIDPSQTRYQALDLGTRVSQAAATAAAGTQSGINTQTTGLNLQEQGLNMASGLGGQAVSDYFGAASSGASGISASNSTASTYGGLQGTATQWGGLANTNYGSSVGALNTGFNNQLGAAQLSEQESQNASSGMGSMVGGALMAAALL